MDITKNLITANFTAGRSGATIQEITIHHAAGAIELINMYTLFNRSTTKASSHYGIKDGNVMQYVDESNTAWTNSNWAANCRAVTIEVSNSGGAPDWAVSEASYNTLIDLVYDIAKRNNLLPLVKGVSLTWHRMYSATTCPGEYLLARIDDIVSKVNAKYQGNDPGYTSEPATGEQWYRVREAWENADTQAGAFKSLDNAKAFADSLNNSPRYTVYDENGNAIYPE